MSLMIQVYVDDTPTQQRIAAEIHPVSMEHVTSKDAVFRLAADWGIPASDVDLTEVADLLPDHDEDEPS